MIGLRRGRPRLVARWGRVPVAMLGVPLLLVLSGGMVAAVTVSPGSESSPANRPPPAPSITTGVADAPVPADRPGASPSIRPVPVPVPRVTVRPVTSITTGPAPSVPSTTSTTLQRASREHSSSARDYGPAAPGSVIVPSSPGQSSWTAVSNGVTLAMRMEPKAPRAGDIVRFIVEATSPEVPCCALYWWLGDGYGFDEGMWGCPTDGGPASPGTARVETTHVYNVHGHMSFMFGAIPGNCQRQAAGINDAQAVMYGYIDIAPGTASAQGPTRPSASLARMRWVGHETDLSYLSVGGRASDQDGYISRLTVDWDDGSAPQTFPGDTRSCKDNSVGWPQGSDVFFPGTSRPPMVHLFTRPGTYAVTVTASSFACDGSEEQQGSATLAWVVPGP